MRYREDKKDREMKLVRAAEAAGVDTSGYWKSEAVDAALDHLIESRENAEAARELEIAETTKQDLINTSVVRYRYRTSVDP